MTPDIVKIITNKHLIAIDQDALGKQAKRIVKGDVDVLVKPLVDGKTAICYFNKTDSTKNYAFEEKLFASEEYVSYNSNGSIIDALSGDNTTLENMLKGEIKARSVKVFII